MKSEMKDGPTAPGEPQPELEPVDITGGPGRPSVFVQAMLGIFEK